MFSGRGCAASEPQQVLEFHEQRLAGSPEIVLEEQLFVDAVPVNISSDQIGPPVVVVVTRVQDRSRIHTVR